MISICLPDGTHTSSRDGLGTWAVVLNNSTSSSLDSEDSSNLENDIYILSAQLPKVQKVHVPLGVVQPESSPVSLIPITFGAFNSQGRLAITST